jgi:hypothetical protein
MPGQRAENVGVWPASFPLPLGQTVKGSSKSLANGQRTCEVQRAVRCLKRAVQRKKGWGEFSVRGVVGGGTCAFLPYSLFRKGPLLRSAAEENPTAARDKK